MRVFNVEYKVLAREEWQEPFWDEMDFEVMEGDTASMICELVELFNDYCDENGYIARMGTVTDITDAA